MGIFDFFKRADIDRGVEEYRAQSGGILLDVRTQGEYLQGHIPDSRNLDVQEIQKAPSLWPDKQVPLFVYCRSGARSAQACSILKRRGYDARNIGGVLGYRGRLERGTEE